MSGVSPTEGDLDPSAVFVQGAVVRGPDTTFAWGQPVATQLGDWWDLRRLGGDSLLVVADVVGHGAPASWLAAMGFGALQMACVGMRETLQPNMLLSLLNQSCVQTFGETPVMSMLAARIDRASGTLSYALAGHPAPVVKGFLGCRALDPTGSPPLGARASERYATCTTPWSPGDLLVAYTDGLPNAQDAGGHRFGERRLLDACSTARANPEDTVLQMRDAVQRHVGGAAPSDDCSVVAWNPMS